VVDREEFLTFRRLFERVLIGFTLAPLLCVGLSVAQTATPQATQSALPSETPENLHPFMDSWDYTRREEMIPMRDGVRLHTVILVPKGAKNAPILLTRTPYNASD